MVQPGQVRVAVGGRQPILEDAAGEGTTVVFGGFAVTGEVTGVP